MNATLLLVHLLGTVALMLWGMRMVRTGVERAAGARLGTLMGRWLKRRMAAFLAGIGLTLALQSATATSVLATGLATRGAVTTTAALAVVLGADVGTTLVALVLSFDLSLLAPLLIAVGFLVHGAATQSLMRQLARATLGLGVVLLSLQLLRSHTAGLGESDVLLVVLGALADEPVLAVLVYALVTWLFHSSLAAVLLAASLAAAGLAGPALAMLLVLGANLGGALPVLGATAGLPGHSRRVPMGNIGFRLVGVILALPWVPVLSGLMSSLQLSPALTVMTTHLAFNLCLAVVFLPLCGRVARILERRWPVEGRCEEQQGAARLLDKRLIRDIDAALSAAARETVRLGDLVQDMYRDVIGALCGNDRTLAKEIAARDDAVDRLHREIKLFVTSASRDEMNEQQSRRSAQILTFVTDLEHIADIIESIAGHARRKAVRGLEFSAEGARDLQEFHDRVMHSMHTAFDVFMSGDPAQAQRLIDEKRGVGRAERELERAHLRRLREGRTESIDTSAFHLDVLRDLKRIHSHLVAVAYATITVPEES